MSLDFPGRLAQQIDVVTHRFLQGLWNRTGGKEGLADGYIWIGTSTGEPTAYQFSGDATLSAVGVLTIGAHKVTYAKFQQVSATDRILGRSTVGAGDVEEITCTAAGRAILDDADATAQRVTLGLGTAAVKNVAAMGDLTVDHVTFSDGKNIVADVTTGTKIGTAVNQKLGLFNATPIVQPASALQAAVTLGNTDNEIGGLTIGVAYSQAEVQALRDKAEELADDVRNLSTLIHAMRTAMVNFGSMKGAA